MIHSGMTCDTAARTLLRDNEVFASLFNTVFFDGEEVIDYKTLVSYENDQSVLIDHQDIKRRRDIYFKRDKNNQETQFINQEIAMKHININLILKMNNYLFIDKNYYQKLNHQIFIKKVI